MFQLGDRVIYRVGKGKGVGTVVNVLEDGKKLTIRQKNGSIVNRQARLVRKPNPGCEDPLPQCSPVADNPLNPDSQPGLV
jgi:hypothetical protein